jgi:hypothetical protein
MSPMEITQSIIFTNQILDKVFIISTTKPRYQLTITQRITVIYHKAYDEKCSFPF